MAPRSRCPWRRWFISRPGARAVSISTLDSAREADHWPR